MTSKRVAFVLVLTCLAVALTAGVAFAAAGAGSNGASDPYAVNPGGTPHTGYATTTVKCAVCHAVHRGPVAGEVLLRGTVANACEFCHIQNNVSTVKVYGQVVANYTTDYENNHSSVGGNSDCVDCHTVHGAGAISTTIGGLNTKILKATAGTLPGGNAGVPGTWAFDDGTVRAGVVSKYCTQCHDYWTAGYDDTALDQNHIMTVLGEDLTTYTNAQTSITKPVQVAYAASTYCTSCHDAGSDTAADNFPHYTSGDRFLLSAASSIAATAAAADPSEDGACLKCHHNGTTGVGTGF
ncbi:MAG: hypothetical protein WBI63_08165 [Coriobacteriia bacterium]